MIGRNVEDRVLGKYLPHRVGPLLPRARAPEVIDPQEATLQEIFAEPGDFQRRQSDRADVRPDEERAFKQRIVGEVNRPVLRLALRVLADARFRQLRRAKHEVEAGIRVVRGPAETVRFAAVAGVHHLAYGEGTVAEVRRGHVERHTRPFHDPEPLSPGCGCRGCQEQADDEDTAAEHLVARIN